MADPRAEADRAIAIKQLSHIKKAKKSGAERITEAEEVLAIAKRAVQVAATAAPTYSLEEVEATITAVTTDNECCVKECKDRRHDPTRGSLYCKKHSDPKTRCRKCNQGLADGNETNWCSICYLLFHKECYVIDCKEPRCGSSYCMHHHDPKT